MKKSMKYYIKPRLYLENQELWCFSDEIQQLSISELQDIIDSFQDVMNNEEKKLYWGWHISSLDMTKKITELSYNSELQAKIPTIEIYNMLKEYLDKLKDYEKKGQL